MRLALGTPTAEEILWRCCANNGSQRVLILAILLGLLSYAWPIKTPVLLGQT